MPALTRPVTQDVIRQTVMTVFTHHHNISPWANSAAPSKPARGGSAPPVNQHEMPLAPAPVRFHQRQIPFCQTNAATDHHHWQSVVALISAISLASVRADGESVAAPAHRPARRA